jgi:AcrR family transcriptional regulator
VGKPFSESDRASVKKKLHVKSLQLFSKYGLKKTTIDDISKAAGIGRGTFYLFYKSKEELFMSIIEEMEEAIKNEICSAIAVGGTDPRAIFKDFLGKIFRILDKNPMLKNLLSDREEFELLFGNLPPERLSAFIGNDDRLVREVLEQFKITGFDLPMAPAQFAGLIRAFYLLPLQKELIGEEAFPGVVDFIAESITYNLLRKIGQ